MVNWINGREYQYYGSRQWLEELVLNESAKQGMLRMQFHMAPETLIDDRGRRIYWGWIAEAREDGAFAGFPKKGWGSVMTLPWHLYPSAENALKIKPVEELKSLRYDPVMVGAITLAPGDLKITWPDVDFSAFQDYVTSTIMQAKWAV